MATDHNFKVKNGLHVLGSEGVYLTDTNTRLHEGNGNALRIQTGTGYVDLGSMNSSWVHFQANKNIYILPSSYVSIDGHLQPHTDSARTLGGNTVRWSHTYTDNITVTDNVTIGGTISSGAITSTGSSSLGSVSVAGNLVVDDTLTIGDNTANSNSFIKFKERIAATETNNPFIGQTNSGNGVSQDLGLGANSSSGTVKIYAGNVTAFSESAVRLKVASDHINFTEPLQMGGTEFLSDSRNLTNIGTISSGAITATTINTGQGATEVYLMNQNVRSSDSPTFQDLTIQGNLAITGDINSYNVTDLDVVDKTITLGVGGTASANDGGGIIVDGANAKLTWNNTNSYWQMNKKLAFNDTATTSNQGLGLVWSGFDKEGTTDFTDNASIVHTTNTGGHAGSVLLFTAQNDANDGIAFVTNASSSLKHNSSSILTAANFTSNITPVDSTKLPLAGGTMTGTLAMGANAITSTGTISSGAITSSGQISISKDNPVLILNDTTSSSNANQVAYISFQDNGTEEAWIGWGSNGNTNFTINNSIGNIVLNGSTTVNAALTATQLNINSGTTNTCATFDSSDDKAFIIIRDDDTDAYLITKDGNFSIGSTSSDYDNFKVNLSNGNTVIDGTFSSGAITSSGAIDGTKISVDSGTGNGLRVHSNSGVTASNNYMNFFTSQTNGWSFNANGTGADSSSVFTISPTGTISSGAITSSGTISAEDNIHLTDAGTVRGKLLLNASDRDNVELRAESLGSTMKFFTVGTQALLLDENQDASFAGYVTSSDYLQHFTYLYSRNNLRVLNSAENGWHDWATRSNGNFNLSVGTINSGAITATSIDAGSVEGNSMFINTPDGGGAPAITALLRIHGYEGRGAGIKIRDSANSASGASNREWFIGSGYAQSGFNIGYASDGSQSSYSAQNKLSIDTSGNATFAGTVDGVDIAARNAVLTTTTNTANAALPKAGGTMTGTLTMGGNAIINANLTGASTYLPGHAFSNTHDGTHVYWHIGSASGSTNKVLNLRIYNSSNNYVVNQWSTTGLSVAGTLTATTVNTGQGANELYAMNQNVRTTDSPTFANLNLGADDTTPLFDMLFDDHGSGVTWDTRIEIGKTDDFGAQGVAPTYIATGGYGMQVQANSDGVFFGMEEYSTGNYRPIIQWGDDNTDSPFRIKHETGSEFTVSYNGIATATTRLTAPTLYSTVATGTSPLTVTSTTLVSNLNADRLDSQHGSYYLDYNNFSNTPTIPSLSGYATQSYVGTQISNLVDSSPAALNTLNELAAALGDDANFSTTVNANIAAKLPLAGGTMTGLLTINATNDNQILLTSPSSWTGIGFNDSAAGAAEYIWHNGTNGTFAIGGGGSNVANKKLHVDGGMTIGSSYDATAVTANSLNVQGTVTATGGNSTNWNTAYGWGNHASAGYLTSSSTQSKYLRSDADDTMSEKLTFSQHSSGAYMQNPGGVTFSSVSAGDGSIVLRNLTQGIRFQDGDNWDYNSWAGLKFDSSADIMYIGGPAASQFTSNASPPSIDINFVGLNSSGLKKDGNAIWHAGNDSSGSGLDADLLDGQQGSYYATASGLTTATATANAALPKAGGTITGNLNVNGTTTLGNGNADQTHINDTLYLGATDSGDSHFYFGENSSSWYGDHWYWDSGYEVERYSRFAGTDTLIEKHDTRYTHKVQTNRAYERLAHSTGYQIGSYNSVAANSAKTNPIYTIGDSYRPSDTSVSGMYGIGYAHSNLWGTGNGKTTGWGQYVVESGAYTQIFSVGGTWSLGEFNRNGNKVWDAGNDGSGSGLDADLLDSYQLNTGRANVANRVVATDSNGYIQAGWINTTSGATSSTLTRIYCSQDGYIRYQTPANFGVSISPHINYNTIANKPTIPTNNNQLTNGAGYTTNLGFSRYNASTTYAFGNLQRFTSNTNLATASGTQSSLEVFSSGSGNDAFMTFHVGSDYAIYLGLDGGTNKLSVGGWSMGANSYEIYHSGNKPSLATLGYTGATNANYITNNNQLTNGAGYITGVTNVSGYAGDLIRQDNRTISPNELTAGRLKFGFTSWGNNNGSPYADFLHLRSYTDASGGADNLVMFKKSGIGMRIWQQTWGSSTAYSNYADVWHTSNDGSGSGLDADLLDGIQASGFIQAGGSWGAANMPGSRHTGISVNGGEVAFLRDNPNNAQMSVLADGAYYAGENNGFYSLYSGNSYNNKSGFYADTSGRLQFSGQTYAQFNTQYGNIKLGPMNGSYAHIYTDTAGGFYFNKTSLYADGNTMWHAGNDGSGSGLDADSLDGYHPQEGAVNNSIVKRDGTASIKAHGISLMRQSTPTTGISWYNEAYYNWQDYMAAAGATTCGPNGNLTAPTGLAGVTSWALRSRMEGVASYGWNWETGGGGGGGATATSKMSLQAVSGNLQIAGSFTAGGDVTAYSDKKLKDDVKVIENAVEKIKQVRGVTFIRNDIEDNKRQAGVIAQEVEKVLPEVVGYDEDRDTKTVAYGNMVGLLIEAIKEQQETIDKLTSRLDDIEKGE
jgi:hypothetical protein